jgi:hypothetical protein
MGGKENKKKIMIVPMSAYKSIKKTALKWRQKMEEAPRHLCPNDLSDEAFIEVLERALWKRGKSLDVQGDSYMIIEE